MLSLDTPYNLTKRLKIRLGGSCNQCCSFCHSNTNDEYEFNPELIPFIKYTGFERIRYNGGEPLLYWDTIKHIIDNVPDYIEHSIVTNGSLFTEEIANYCIEHCVKISLSINEFTNLSDENCLALGKLNNIGTSALFSGALSFDEMDKERDKLVSRIKSPITNFYNLMHPIDNNHSVYREEDKENYIKWMTTRVFTAIDNLPRVDSSNTIVLLNFMRMFEEQCYGCSNPTTLTVSLDGRIMECSYNTSYIGKTINDYYDFLPTPHPDKCYSCQLFGRCKSCYIAINDDECTIYNELYSRLINKLDSMNLTYDLVLQYLKFQLNCSR